MNVKQGDLAYIVGSSKFAGRTVEVIARAPNGVKFLLPDGYPQNPTSYEWVVKFNAPVEAPTTIGTRMTHFGCAPDRLLRPISGVPVPSELTDEITA